MVEFKPVERPVEPLESDQPVKCLLLEPSILNYGIVYQLGIANKSTSIAVYLLSWIYVVVAVAIYLVIMHAHDEYSAKEHIYYWAVKLFVICLTTLVVIILLRFTRLLALGTFLQQSLTEQPIHWIGYLPG